MPADQPALDLSTPQRVHIVGIGGAGMSAIAGVLAAMGHRVTGSDLKASPVSERLASQGIVVTIGHRAEALGEVDVVTASPAVPDHNAEIVAARERAIPVVPRSTMLAAIAATRRCLAVAGTHGKTTTASMLSLALAEAGLRPSFLIGADVNEIGTNAAWAEGEWLVVEADESFGTFQALKPEISLIGNVEADHLDYYGSVEALFDAFSAFAASTSGPVFVGADDAGAADIGARVGAVSVGLAEGADYRMTEVALARSSVAFDLRGPGGRLGRVALPIPGLHNARNAAIAVVGALAAGAPFEAATAALARFAGVPRRFEFRGSANGVTFVDDYAHLPTEVRATLAAARAGGWARVIAIFQPHRFTRTAALSQAFADAFVDADAVIVTEIYGAGERAEPGVSGKLVADAILAAHPAAAVRYVPQWSELRDVVSSMLRQGDLCCTLGAGDLTSLPDELLADPRW